MNPIKSAIAARTQPKHLTPDDGIQYWQERILRSLLLAATILGTLTWAPSVYLSIKEGLWMVAWADTFVLGYVIILTLNPGLSYTARAWGMAAISYSLGLILMFTLGPYGAGPSWIFFFPILTAVLLGRRATVWALAFNCATVLFVGVLIYFNRPDFMARFGFKAWHLVDENPEMKWVVVCANFMLLNILTTVVVTMVLDGLNKSLMRLSVSRKKYRRIFDNIIDIYFETAIDGTILEVSPSLEKVFGFTREELLGTPVTALYRNPEDRRPFIETLLSAEQIDGYELNLKTRTGRPLTCSANVRLIRDSHGDPQKLIGIFRDITEQQQIAQRKKELEERLNRSQKMEALGLLAGGVAHDLNNVLSGIVTYPDLLLMDTEPNSPMAKGLQTIQASGLRATEIVQDLLTLSRRGVVNREVVDLNQIVREFLRTPEYEKILSFHPNVTVSTDIAANAPRLRGSDIHLQKTVMNLISNAAEAQPLGGMIRITTMNHHLDQPVKGYDRVAQGDYLVLSVEDQGEGIATEDLKRIFEPFFTKKVMGRSGTGLGMAVVWGTVQDHDGYIDVTSAPGRGTRFDLYFPVTRELPESIPGSIGLDRLMGQGERILIVDDDPHQRQIATGLLERLNYSVFTAENGETAVSLMRTREADLLLLDMIMDPGIDGLETYRRIKAFRPDQKAVIASGFSRTRQVKDTLALGAGQYIKKPYTLEEIGLAVRKELDRDQAI